MHLNLLRGQNKRGSLLEINSRKRGGTHLQIYQICFKSFHIDQQRFFISNPHMWRSVQSKKKSYLVQNVVNLYPVVQTSTHSMVRVLIFKDTSYAHQHNTNGPKLMTKRGSHRLIINSRLTGIQAKHCIVYLKIRKMTLFALNSH